MPRSFAKTASVAWLLMAAIGLGCGDQSSERRGGQAVPDLTAGSGELPPDAGSAGASEGGAAGSDGAPPVAFCDAYAIINCVCQQCHQNPPRNGAPIPLLTYEDTQAPFPLETSSRRVWQTMQTVIGNDFMPYRGNAKVMPPVQPLSAEQKRTLLTWLTEGARDEGGRDCSMKCDWSKPPPPAP